MQFVPHFGTVKCIIGVFLFIHSTFLHTLSIPGPVRPGLFWSGAPLAVSVAVLQDDGLLWLCTPVPSLKKKKKKKPKCLFLSLSQPPFTAITGPFNRSLSRFASFILLDIQFIQN